MTKRTKITDTHEKQKIIATCQNEIKPPEHLELSEHERQEFDQIIDEHPKSEWTPHKLSMAAILAQLLSNIALNPTQTGISQKINSALSIRRNLGLHAAAQHGDARDMRKRMGMTKDIETKVSSILDDPLIGPPLIPYPDD